MEWRIPAKPWHIKGKDGENAYSSVWWKEFHVHVDDSAICLGAVLAYPGEGSIDLPITFASRKLSTIKRKYTMIDWEGLDMVYAWKKLGIIC